MSRRHIAALFVGVASLFAACGEDGVRIGGVSAQGLDSGPVNPSQDASATTDTGSTPSAGACLDRVLNGLVVYLPFEEANGATTANATPFANDGTLVNMNDSDWVDGRDGNALDFDGIDDGVNIRRGDLVSDVRPLTVCAWINPRSYPGRFASIANKSAGALTGGWDFYIEDDGTFGLLTNEQQWVTENGIVLGQWQHVCATWDGTQGTGGIEMYRNGLPRDAPSTGSNGTGFESDANKDLMIGRINDGTFGFDGMIDEYRLYGRILTGDEIQALYECPGPAP